MDNQSYCLKWNTTEGSKRLGGGAAPLDANLLTGQISIYHLALSVASYDLLKLAVALF